MKGLKCPLVRVPHVISLSILPRSPSASPWRPPAAAPPRVRGTGRRCGAVAGKPRAPQAPLLRRGAALVAFKARAPSLRGGAGEQSRWRARVAAAMSWRNGARPAAPRRSGSGDLELRPGGGAKAE